MSEAVGKPRGLGRGLNALFEDEEEFEASVQSNPDAHGAKRQTLGIEQIEPNADQPRRQFNEETLEELATSIKEHGLLQPIIVQSQPGNIEKYEIIAGERRWRASQKAQLHEVPVIIMNLDESDAFKVALIENLQREDLNPMDEAKGYERLISKFGNTPDEVAETIGKSRSHVANMVRLMKLPPQVQTYVSSGDLGMGHARALINAQDPETLADIVMRKNLSVRATEKLVAEEAGRPPAPSSTRGSSASKTQKDADTIALENEISNSLGMRVSINSPNGQSGDLVVTFKDLDQLDDLLHRLSNDTGSRLIG